MYDLKLIEEKIKRSKDTEEAPFEGEIQPIELAKYVQNSWA